MYVRKKEYFWLVCPDPRRLSGSSGSTSELPPNTAGAFPQINPAKPLQVPHNLLGPLVPFTRVTAPHPLPNRSAGFSLRTQNPTGPLTTEHLQLKV